MDGMSPRALVRVTNGHPSQPNEDTAGRSRPGKCLSGGNRPVYVVNDRENLLSPVRGSWFSNGSALTGRSPGTRMDGNKKVIHNDRLALFKEACEAAPGLRYAD